MIAWRGAASAGLVSPADVYKRQVPKSLFEVEIDKMKEAKGVKNDVDLTADDLKELVLSLIHICALQRRLGSV